MSRVSFDQTSLNSMQRALVYMAKGIKCHALSHIPAYGSYAASRVRFAKLQKRSSPLTPLQNFFTY
jgi:hypothetical protein